MAENGPRTQELVGEVREIERRLTERGTEIQARLTSLETKMLTVEGVMERSGVDLEAIKLTTQETKVTQRLTLAVGGMLGTLLVSLVLFAATRA